jgi:hypothetical protein
MIKSQRVAGDVIAKELLFDIPPPPPPPPTTATKHTVDSRCSLLKRSDNYHWKVKPL